MLTLYTTEKKLIEICEEGEDWYNIVKRQSDVYICNDSESGEWDVTNNLLLALHRSGTSIIVDNDVLSDIKKDDSKVMDLPNPVYILDFKEDEAKAIEEKYGVLFLSTTKTPKPILAKRGWSIDTTDANKPKTWEYFLKNIKVHYNSILIVDRYFFSSLQGESIEDSLYNLREILNSLLPPKRMFKFTVSIVFDERESDMTMQDLSKKANKVKKSIVGKTPFTLELISINKDCYKYEDTHDRFIISNYFVINATHKIKAFRAGNKTLCAQKIFFDYLYSNGIDDDDISSIPVVSQDRVINTLLDSLKTSKNEILYASNGTAYAKGNINIENELLL